MQTAGTMVGEVLAQVSKGHGGRLTLFPVDAAAVQLTVCQRMLAPWVSTRRSGTSLPAAAARSSRPRLTSWGRWSLAGYLAAHSSTTPGGVTRVLIPAMSRASPAGWPQVTGSNQSIYPRSGSPFAGRGQRSAIPRRILGLSRDDTNNDRHTASARHGGRGRLPQFVTQPSGAREVATASES